MKAGLSPLLALLALALGLTLGFAEGPRLSEEDVRDRARTLPEVAELLEKPTVEPEASYREENDVWRVVLREQVSESAVADLTVEDDTGTVLGVRISPRADDLEYPSLSEEDATRLVTANPEVREELSRYDGHTSGAEYEDGEWTVHFWTEDPESGAEGDEEAEVARASVDDDTWQIGYVYTGDQVNWRMARGEPGAYGKQANYAYVWGPLAAAFALVFLRTDKLFSLRNLDVAVLLSFLVSHHFFREGDSFWSVVLWYPPLLYLLARTLLMGFGVGEKVEKTSDMPNWLILALGALASGLVVGLNLESRVIDVGYAGIVGGDLLLSGTLPYGNMPDDIGTGDTYGPLNYLLYVPFILIYGFSGEWGDLPAVKALTVFSFFVGLLALAFAGYRLSGTRGALALAFAWAAFPYTLYSTNNNTNDIIVGAIAALGLAAATSPLGRGATVAAGFAIKLFPLALAPLWMLHDGPKRSPLLRFLAGGAAVVLGSFWVLAVDGNPVAGARAFYERTLVFQSDRETPWTIYSQLPQLEVLQTPLIAGLVLLGFVVAVYPRRRTVRRLAAFSAALVIAFQLTTNYWFYPYVTWFEPFVFLALLTATNKDSPLDGDPEFRKEASDGLLSRIGQRVVGRWVSRE